MNGGTNLPAVGFGLGYRKEVFIGNQTSCWAKPTEPFDYALAQGFNAFEWFPDKKPECGWDEQDLDAAARASIRQAAQARGMRLSVHSRWQANPLMPESRELFARDLELASDLGASLLNIHLAHERGVEVFVKAIMELAERTAEAGLQLAIENTPHHVPEQFNELFARLREVSSVPSSHIGMCLDVGHANLSSATLNDYLAFCDRLDARVPIIHLHLHENWGDADTHLPLFTGPAAKNDSGMRGLLQRLQQRRFSGSIILEQWPQPPSLLNAARDRLLALWGPSQAPEPPQPVPAAPASPAITSRATYSNLVSELAAGDKRCRSWREKLEFVSGILARDDPALSSEDLVLIAIYLRFLSTGQISCADDGRHFRPGHHAKLASQIHERLAQVRTPANEFILRKIYPWLPSDSAVFQKPEPLTRIRDIAHRNDIDPDLKREIKTRLQNKLHRCAGPEDMATASELLERITAAGSHYSAEFVEQFKIFHRELQEFFNARSLEDRLNALVKSAQDKQRDLIPLFLKQKEEHDTSNPLATLRSLSALRSAFADQMKRPGESANTDVILADIALEDFAFVLLSQIINQVNPQEADKVLGEALTLSLRNVALSGIDPPESLAIESELLAWSQSPGVANREQILRWRASLLRSRRFAEEFGAKTVALFSGRVQSLGHALGVEERAINVFSEADIRSHVVFQVSKISDRLLVETRKHLGLQPWDVVVPGEAVGRAVALPSLAQWKPESGARSVVILAHSNGDEEIPAEIAAIALGHELPHLAHLSVRARQAGVVLACCEDASEFEKVRSLTGRNISFTAALDKVVIAEDRGKRAASNKAPLKRAKVPAVRLAPEPAWLELDQAPAEAAGGKANAVGRLAELARGKDAGFHTPPGLAIPFGILETAIDRAGELGSQYRKQVQRLEGLSGADFAPAVGRLREMIRKLKTPQIICDEVRRRFSQGGSLVVRSSANCEDLEEFAGAGLYESVINVPPAHVASAIQDVWASLWTQRAAESRRAAKIPHEQAHMAVLVQQLVNPEYSFVLHTVNPVTGDPGEIYGELVVGLGETLASAAVAGSPYRLTCGKASGSARVLAFANFSHASHPAPERGLTREVLDYSKVELSRRLGALEEFGSRLVKIGSLIERAFNGPQDIEGAIARGNVYLVQARPQQGLPATKSS